MRLGAVTYNVLKDWDLETIVTNLEQLGFEAVELRTEHKHGVEVTATREQRQQVSERFARSKVRLLSYGTTCEFHSPDEAVRRQNIELAKKWVDLAHDTGAWGVKVRPNGVSKELGLQKTVEVIAASLREVGEYGARMGVEIWMEVHGRETQNPEVSAAIMKATRQEAVGLCWNSNPTDVVNGSVKESFALLRPWIKNVHVNELAGPYPYRELFALLRGSLYDRYVLCEAQESKEPMRFLRWYRALFLELSRPCA
ncbi:MAG: sugar phosphate isomerase/epimerase [Bryobacteraceae bacterium]|nr:sugar phosphate isomerase/epimerase [Bryobacteraceae bacterium]MDW8378436.1 sugar phosphate isomerase/epimerase family protein [Bryobacterales bacterium]